MKQRIQDCIDLLNSHKPANAEELEAFRIRFNGKKGILTQLFDDFRTVSPEAKKEFGRVLNDLKKLFQDRFEAIKQQLESAADQKESGVIDLTRNTQFDFQGSRHPLSIVREKILDIFIRMGFAVEEGPEIEDDYHNFGALNFADDHPARDMQDTFFIQQQPPVLLRTHTSSVQVRAMQSGKPPFRAVFPGRVYRNEAISARAHCFFHQIEGLYIDKNVSFADLRHTLLHFAQELFDKSTRIRLRPSYFPFTEPSAEMDISCNLCGGTGCAFCKHTGWVEILGCGMVDPNVLKNCGIDPGIYSGYAFGIGVERITNLLFNVKDLRMFSENDLRFLEQFASAE